MIHELKTKRQYFNEIVSGNKTFEVRKNDRDFRYGDYLALNEINDDGEYTGLSIVLRIQYILDDQEYCKPGYVIIGFAPCVVHKIMNDVPIRQTSGFVLERFDDDDPLPY